jgi:uncharacterized membrane protein
MIRVHLAGCIAALLLGGLVAWLPKGTPVHRLLGWCYVLATVVYAGSALTIFPSTGHFTPFHAIAVQSFALVGLGIGAARAMSRRSTVWRIWHLRFMLYSYVALAATGLRFGLPYLAGGRAGPILVFTVVPACSWWWIEHRVVKRWRTRPPVPRPSSGFSS